MRRLLLSVLLLAAAPQVSQLRQLQALDQRVANVAFTLAAANANQCPKKARLTGLVVHSLGQYGPSDRAQAKADFGFDRFPQVLGVAKDSPAARAGLRVDDQLTSINGTSLVETQGKSASLDAVSRTLELIDAATANGAARLTIKRGSTLSDRVLTAVPGCASHVEMIPSNKRSGVADGIVVQVTSGAVLETRDDDELAFLIGHELAHNIKGHYDWLRANKRTTSNIRKTEIEADEMAVWMAARAGYDPYGGTRFWAHYGGGLAGGIFSDGTHMRDGQRTVFLREVANRVSASGTQ